MKQLPVTKCQYCGVEDIGEGWQNGEAIVRFRYNGFWGGNRLQN